MTTLSKGYERPMETLDDVVREHIKKALERTGWNITEAAKLLEVGRATIYRKVKRYWR